MRAAILTSVVALAGCPGGSGDGTCQLDADCGGGASVCARTGECLAPSEVRTVTVKWTVRGMPASATTCVDSPDLYIQFDGSIYMDVWGYDPVPCAAGQFTVDKLPTRYVSVELGVGTRLSTATVIDPQTGIAMLDFYP